MENKNIYKKDNNINPNHNIFCKKFDSMEKVMKNILYNRK